MFERTVKEPGLGQYRDRRRSTLLVAFGDGDRIVGRIEPRLDRRSGELAMLGIWFEPDFEPMEEPHFVPALAAALAAYRALTGATTVARALHDYEVAA